MLTPWLRIRTASQECDTPLIAFLALHHTLNTFSSFYCFRWIMTDRPAHAVFHMFHEVASCLAILHGAGRVHRCASTHLLIGLLAICNASERINADTAAACTCC